MKNANPMSLLKRLVASISAAALLLSMPVAAQIGSPGYQFLEAVRDRDTTKVNEFLSESTTLINTREITTGQTALLIVVERRDTVWLRYLLQRGADANIGDRSGVTPLIRATQLSFVEGVDALIRRGARVNDGGNSGETPLHLAVQRRDLAMVRALMAAGANPDISDNITGLTPRDLAIRDTRASAVLAVLSERPPVPAPRASGPN